MHIVCCFGKSIGVHVDAGKSHHANCTLVFFKKMFSPRRALRNIHDIEHINKYKRISAMRAKKYRPESERYKREVLGMGELSKLPNIGKAVEAQLIQVGIETPEALRQVGAKAAWLKIQEIDPSACIHRLMALEGAIQGVKKTGLPDAVKADLKAFYQGHKL